MLSRRLLLPILPFAFAAPLTLEAQRASGTITGTVHDSLSGSPLAGALVQLVRYPDPGSSRALAAETDSAGEFRITGADSGRYAIGFLHPLLDALGIEAPLRQLSLGRGETIAVDLAIPSSKRILPVICHGPVSQDSTGALVGRVRDAETEAPVAGASVVLVWSDLVVTQSGIRQERREIPARVGGDGWYRFCRVPSDIDLVARAELPPVPGRAPAASGFVELRVPARGILVKDFSIGGEDVAVHVPGDSADGRTGDQPAVRRGDAIVSGVVRGSNGKAISGARVLVWGSEAQGTTDQTGAFMLRSLPSGTHSLEVRQIGYAPKRVGVELSARRPARTIITLTERTAVLAPVTVFGRAPPRSITGFLERRQRGLGLFLTRDEIAKTNPFDIADVLRRAPAVRVTPSATFGYRITMRGGCVPSVYINGHRIDDPGEDIDALVRPEDIAAMEVYSGQGQTPAEFQSAEACGSIVIWTGAGTR